MLKQDKITVSVTECNAASCAQSFESRDLLLHMKISRISADYVSRI